MAAFTYIRGLGLWIPDSEVTSAEFEAIEARWPKILHSDGGTWTQAADIQLNGSGTIELGGSTKWLKVGSRSVSIKVPLTIIDKGSGWDTPGVSAGVYTLNQNAAANSSVWFSIPPLPVGTLNAVQVTVDPAAHGTLPSQQPVLYANVVSGSGLSQIGVTTDAQGTTGAYDAAHTITVSGLSTSTDNTFVFSVDGESGTNFAANLKLYLQALVTLTLTSIQPQ